MPSEPTVPVPGASDEVREHDYEALHAALSASARGRAFLTEYTRRNRNADTEAVLDALSRLETLVHKRPAPQPAPGAVRDELRGLLDTIRTARLPVAASAMPEKAAKLAALIAELEHRIAGLIAPAPAGAPAQFMAHAPVQAVRQVAAPAPPEIKPIPLHLAVVPPSEEPELPIPSPAAQPPVIKLVGTLARIPEIDWFEPDPLADDDIEALLAAPPVVETVDFGEPSPEPATPETPSLPLVAAVAPPPEPVMPDPVSDLPPADPLAVIMLLSEEERLALFT